MGSKRPKAGFRKVYEVALRYSLDSEQVYAEQGPGLFVKEMSLTELLVDLLMTFRDGSGDISLLVTLA